MREDNGGKLDLAVSGQEERGCYFLLEGGGVVVVPSGVLNEVEGEEEGGEEGQETADGADY